MLSVGLLPRFDPRWRRKYFKLYYRAPFQIAIQGSIALRISLLITVVISKAFYIKIYCTFVCATICEKKSDGKYFLFQGNISDLKENISLLENTSLSYNISYKEVLFTRETATCYLINALYLCLKCYISLLQRGRSPGSSVG